MWGDPEGLSRHRAQHPRCPQTVQLRAGRGLQLLTAGIRADAEILTAYLDHCLPRTDLRYHQPAALGPAEQRCWTDLQCDFANGWTLG
ncbi:DUF6000 family protein [Streptomyces sp. NBC_00328]|uniref:DUF6000 family protein n=1 Tax=Streptomyces sp. NBC_00328 TaxID=2903646 RepID=UPI002E2C7CCD|nr:DUF6000 family protein [Streptomyces sp. NBC_00328]